MTSYGGVWVNLMFSPNPKMNTLMASGNNDRSTTVHFSNIHFFTFKKKINITPLNK